MRFVRRYAAELAVVVAVLVVLAYGYRRNVPQTVAPAAAADVHAVLGGGPIAAATTFAIDTMVIGATRYPVAGHAPTFEVPAGEPVDVEGWAVDAPAGDAARAVAGSFGAAYVVAFRYGVPRPDVAAALHNAKYATSGFSGHIPPAALRPGRYPFALDVAATGRPGYYHVATPITLIVR